MRVVSSVGVQYEGLPHAAVTILQATAIIKLLANRGLTANPKSAIASTLHTTSLDPLIALQLDRQLATLTIEISGVATRELTDSEFETVSRNATSYFEVVVSWSEGSNLSSIANPCRNFSRTRFIYLEPVNQVRL